MAYDTNLVHTLMALDAELASNLDNYSGWVCSRSKPYSDLVYELGEDAADSIVEYLMNVYCPF